MGRAIYSAPVPKQSDAETSPFGPVDVKHLWRRILAYGVDLLLAGTLVVLATILLGWWHSRLELAGTRGHLRDVTIQVPLLYDPLHDGWNRLTTDVGLVPYGHRVIAVAILVAYFVLLEWALGATAGKAIFGLRVVDFTGKPLTLLQAAGRNVIRSDRTLLVPTLLPLWIAGSATLYWDNPILPYPHYIIYGWAKVSPQKIAAFLGVLVVVVGFIRVARNPRRQRRGDIWAGSLVVSRKTLREVETGTGHPEPVPYGFGASPAVISAQHHVTQPYGYTGPGGPAQADDRTVE